MARGINGCFLRYFENPHLRVSAYIQREVVEEHDEVRR